MMPEIVDEPLFTHEQLYTKINKLLHENSFKNNLLRMKGLMTEASTASDTVQMIKNAAESRSIFSIPGYAEKLKFIDVLKLKSSNYYRT